MPANGSFTISNNAGSFIVNPTADVTTEGVETFTVSLRTGSVTGPVVATSSAITVNDVSLSLPAGYVTLAGLTWAPMVTGGTYAAAQTYAANFTGLGFSAGTWRTATVAEIQSLTAVLSYADAQSDYGWTFSSHDYNIWTSESGRVVNFFTGANVGTSNTNMFNFLVCKIPA